MVEDKNDFVADISIDVSLLKSLISVLNVWNVSDDKSSNSLPFSALSSLTSRDNSLDVYPDKSVI